MFLGLPAALMFVVLWSSRISAASDQILCFHRILSHWRQGNGKFVVSDIDTNFCTDVIYSYIGVSSDGAVGLNSYDPGFLTEYGKLKDRTPKPKLLLAIGGWSEGTTTFSPIAASAALRKKLLDSVIALIAKYNFDGLVIDWEYPLGKGGSPTDYKNFVPLLQEFRAEFTKRGYKLCVVVTSTIRNYDISGISKNVDCIIVLTVDIFWYWYLITEHHSSYPDTVKSINEWMRVASPHSKLLLRIDAYGRSFTLSNSNNNGLGASAMGVGVAGPYTGESGYLGYNEICEKIKGPGWSQKWSREWASQLSVPYAYGGNQWVGYDDPESIAIKGKFAVDNKLGGIAIWSVDTDDFRGIWGSKYPLLNAIKTALKLQNSGSTITTTIPQPIQAPASLSTGTGVCKAEGYVRDSCDCSKYYYCQWNGSSYIIHPFQCASGFCYDTKTGSCNGGGICKAEGYVRDSCDCSKYYYCQLNGSSYITHSFQCGSGLYYDTKTGVCNWRDQVSCP